ncbi:MAG: Tn3 family transposase, partial [Candidatus Binatia bacterium]
LCARILDQLSPTTLEKMDALLETTGLEASESDNVDLPEPEWSIFSELKRDAGPVGVESAFAEVAKLERIDELGLPDNLFQSVSHKVLSAYWQRAAAEPRRDLARHPNPIRYTLLAAFCWMRRQEIADNLVDLLIQIMHRIGTKAEKKVVKELLEDLRRVRGKTGILFRIAEAAVNYPDGVVRDVLYPVAGEQTLRDLVREFKSTGPAYRMQVQTRMHASYRSHYRRVVPKILSVLDFRSNNELHRPVIQALEVLRKHAGSTLRFYPKDKDVPVDSVVPSTWEDLVIKPSNDGYRRINRIAYEICVLQALRERLRSKEIWVVGTHRYRNPDEDLPTDFEVKRTTYYEALHQPLGAEVFIGRLQQAMREALSAFDAGLPGNPAVNILPKGKGWIRLSPLKSQPEPQNLACLRGEIAERWPMTNLLDILKETDLRTSFTDHLKSSASRESMDREMLQKRLLLCLYALGTNLGIKRVGAGDHGGKYTDLMYVRRRYIHKDQLRKAINHVVNSIFRVRLPDIWGEATTACASDSKQFGAWDQNLMTEWHNRYGGRGVMIYWHVERKAACIYSQLKQCSSSEVAAMIEGVLRHCTDMAVEKQYVDSHGQSHVAFAFCHLLGFKLLPRLKAIRSQKLYRPQAGQSEVYPNLQQILTRPINWELIRRQYDEMIKYATALRLGTAEAEAILRRFTRSNLMHPTYQALSELGKAVKTVFLCDYLRLEKLRHEIQEALNVIELWNGVNNFIFCGKAGEITTNRRDEQELAMLALHLLQNCLVYINTLMIQRVLAEPAWKDRLTLEDLRGLTPLIYAHINPYGSFLLDMEERLII